MSGSPSFSRTPARLWPLIACLYVSQGIPFGLAMEAMPASLRHAGTDLQALAWLPLVGLPWVLKWLWAPWVDNHWSPRTGRRRSWILPMQGLVLAALLAVALLGLSAQTLPWILGLAVTASLASATQDVATDALVSEQFATESLPMANAIQVASTMVGFFYGGPVFLMLYGTLGLTWAIVGLVLPIAASLVLALSWREPQALEVAARTSKASQWHFLRSGRNAWVLVVAACLSAITVVACHGLGKLLLVDAQWPLARVGQVGMLGGAFTILVGCGGGAWLVRRFGAWPAFQFGIASAGLSAVTWAWLATQTPAMPMTAVVMATVLASIGSGCASVAIMTAAMHFCRQRTQAGTDMTMVQSARDLGETMASSFLIALAARVGYTEGFLLGMVLAGVTILATAWMIRSRLDAHCENRGP